MQRIRDVLTTLFHREGPAEGPSGERTSPLSYGDFARLILPEGETLKPCTVPANTQQTAEQTPQTLTPPDVPAPPVHPTHMEFDAYLARIPEPSTASRLQPWQAMLNLRRLAGAIFPPSVFLYQAARFEEQEHAGADPVPLQMYHPLHSALTPEQAAWYFTWRSGFRLAQAWDTDLSYLFLHAYELIHGVGTAGPEDAFCQLRRLWTTYRSQHPKLDAYLPVWLVDLQVYYRLGSHLTDDLRHFPPPRTAAPLALQMYLDAPVHTRGEMPDLAFRSATGWTPSGFAAGFPDQPGLRALLRAALETADEFHREAHGTSVYEALRGGQETSVHRAAFRETGVFQGQPLTYRYARSYEPHVPEVRVSLGDAARYTENLLRARSGVRGKVRHGEVPEALKERLTDLVDASGLAPVMVTRPPASPEPVQITVDPARVAALLQGAVDIRAALLEHLEEEPVSLPVSVPAPPLPAPPLPTSSLTAFLAALEGDEHTLLRLIMAGTASPAHLAAALPDVFVSLLVDRVNDAAFETFGDLLIDPDTLTLQDLHPDLRAALARLETV